jgi:hypothetical protein
LRDLAQGIKTYFKVLPQFLNPFRTLMHKYAGQNIVEKEGREGKEE